MPDVLIGSIKKNDTTETRMTISDFKGKKSINIREWYKTDKMADWAPTKKGVNIATGSASDLVSLAEKAEDELKK